MRDGAKARTLEGTHGLHSRRSVQQRRRGRPRRASVHLMRSAAHNPTQDHYQDFIQCMANVPLPLDVTLVCNQATGQFPSHWPGPPVMAADGVPTRDAHSTYVPGAVRAWGRCSCAPRPGARSLPPRGVFHFPPEVRRRCVVLIDMPAACLLCCSGTARMAAG
jgi:hypothetical protein